MNNELHFQSAGELAQRLRRKEVSALELLDHHIERVQRLDDIINAIPVRDFDRARERARAADAALARGEFWGPLHGVPMTVKESFDVAGLPSTFGYPAYAGNIAASDAVAVRRLLDAGALIFGKTNVPVALADWQSFNPVYGSTGNPWDPARTPGGSSGGSAAALAAGLSALELGSDIGASIRNPAHYCGVWGHKPTWGVVPTAGHELVAAPNSEVFDIAAGGPLARSAFDLQLALELVCAPLSAVTPLGRIPAQWRSHGKPPRRMRVAVLDDDAEAPVDASIRSAFADLAGFLRREGVDVVEGVKPVDSAEAHEVYLMLLRAATGAKLDAAVYADMERRRETLAADDRSYPAYLYRGSTVSHRDWCALDQRRWALRQRWAAFFEQHDLLICPVATTPAFRRNESGERWERMIPVDGTGQPTTTALYWAGYPGLPGLPATAVPIATSGPWDSTQGLPIGAQIVAPWYGDLDALRFAQWLETAYRGFVAPPLG